MQKFEAHKQMLAPSVTPRFAQHARDALRHAERYSVFVRVMKRALPLLAGALAASVIVYTLQPREGARQGMTFEKVGLLKNDLAMTHPRLTGVDGSGQPFTVTADRAIQETGNSVRLYTIKATMDLHNGATLSVNAPEGLIYTDDNRLEVSKGIALATDTGFSASTKSMTVNMRTGMVYGDTPVRVRGPSGVITADRFTLSEADKEVHFSGHVHMLLNHADQPAADAPALRSGAEKDTP